MKTGLTRGVLAIMLLAMVSPVNNASAQAPTPIPITWDTRAKGWKDPGGARFTFVCPAGGTLSYVYGTDSYDSDSSICTAAVHVGLITTASGGTVTIENVHSLGGRSVGSTRNGVTSHSWGPGYWRFVVVGAAPVTTGPTPIPQPNTDVTNMTIQVAQRKVITGELVLVPVWLIKANNVANINYQITYDAKVAKPEGALTKGNLLENALFSVNANQSGSVLSGFAQTTGLAGTGTVLNIPFRAVGKPGDRTSLDVTVTAINDPNGGVLKIDRIAGEILIANNEGIIPQNPPPGPGVQPIPPPPPPMPRGDCDGDGNVTEVDALCALEISVNLRPSTPLMDMDNSGGVTSRDAVIILQRAIFKEVES